MNAIEHIVHNIKEITERFQGKDCDSLSDRKRVYKELEKAKSPLVENVSSAMFNTIVHTVIGTINALSTKEANVMPSQDTQDDSVMPSQDTQDASVMPTQDTQDDSVMPTQDTNVMPTQDTQDTSVMPTQETVINVMPSQETIEKNNTSIATKGVDIITNITDNGITEKGEGQLNMFEVTLEDRILALEKAMAELIGTRPHRVKIKPVLEKIKPVRDVDAPANYKGYTVNFGNGNYRLIKRVGGRLRCIHVGKVWSVEKADAALMRWSAKDAAVVTDSILGATA